MVSKFYCLSPNFDEEEFIKERKRTHLRTYIKEKNIVIDSILVCDRENKPFETMIFPMASEEEVNWRDMSCELYVENYLTFEEMQKRHNELVKEWSDKK